MAGGKLTPRQKMINMMYLVLTALLALNVSQEVLNAFKLVNDGLQTSNGSLNEKNAGIYKAFDKQMDTDKGKAQQYYDKAQKAKQIGTELNKLLEQYKTEIIKQADGIDPESGDIVQRDNIDIATRMFVEEGEGVKRGKALQQKIADARKQLLALVDAGDQANFKLPLTGETPKLKGSEKNAAWEYATFNHVPTTAAVTILTKFQNDVVSSEGAVIEYLIKKIGETDFKFDALAAKIIAPSSYIMQGQSYKADIFLAAFNSTQQPEVFLGPIGGFKRNPDGTYDKVDSQNPLPAGYSESGILKTEGGMAKLERGGGAVGESKYTGIIRVKNPVGGYTFYPFEGGYQVAAKAVVVSPTQMNVLYIGVPNPMEISVPGVGTGDVSASMTAGTLARNANGTYTATVSSVGKTMINVSAKVEGKVQPMGSKEFRVKRIPDPIPTLGGKLRGGNTQPGSIKAQSGVVALMENFDFDAKFAVVSFQMVFSSKGEIFKSEAQGPLFNAQMKSFLDRAKPKDIIFIDEIKVVGPDKQPRKLGQIAFQII